MDSLRAGDIINMVAKGNEKIKEKLGSAVVHLKLHGAATLEGATAADDQSEIVGPKFRVGVWCVGVRVTG